MKIYFLFLSLLLLISCQSEEDTQIVNDDNGLGASSALTSNLKRLTQNPTAFDNFIDNSSKIKVDFPFSVTVNNNFNIDLESNEDYQNLIGILESTVIQDTIALNFPLSVSTVNYSTQTFSSQPALTEFLQNLPASDEVNCVELSYPISLLFFDSSNTFIDSQTLFNRAQLFNFLNDLNQNGFFYQIDYPLEVVIEGNAEIINSNAEFNTAFNSLSSSCFEPLLYENEASETNPINLEDFIGFISDGDFIVTLLSDEDGENNTEFEGIVFNFNSNNLITVEQETVGEWSAFVEDETIIFDLDFDDSFYGELDDDWQVLSFDEETLTLIDISTDGDSTDLVFSKL